MEPKTEVIYPIMCQCCGREKMAEIRGHNIIIYDTRHGQRHFVVLDLEKLANSALIHLTK